MDRSIPRLALIGLGVTILAIVLVTGATSTSSFGTHNPSWDGTADLRAIADEQSSTEIVRNVSAYDETSANDTLAIILSPGEPYGNDVDAIRQFLDRGGTVLIAEDYRPNGNRLLSSLDATVRFNGQPLRDERNYERSPNFVEATIVSDQPLTSGYETLVLNRGTVIDPGEASVLVRTSQDAYLDVNRNEALDDDETPAARPVMAVEPVGNGRVITLGDPSVFINSMLEYGDNRAFATQLAEGHDRVIFDVSHSPGIPPLVAVLLTVRDSLFLQILIGFSLTVGVAGRHRIEGLADWIRQIGRQQHTKRSSPTDPDAIARAVSREHPSWDETRIERIANGAVESTTKNTMASDGDGDEPIGDRVADADRGRNEASR